MCDDQRTCALVGRVRAKELRQIVHNGEYQLVVGSVHRMAGSWGWGKGQIFCSGVSGLAAEADIYVSCSPRLSSQPPGSVTAYS